MKPQISILFVLILLSIKTINCWKPVLGITASPPLHISKPVTTYHGKLAPSIVISDSLHDKPSLVSVYSKFESAGKTYGGTINGIHSSSILSPASDHCGNYKVGFIQDLYFQYVQYKFNMPDLKEFTLCMWTKFTNHSNDHPLFSYAVDGQPKAILATIANTDRSSYFSLAVAGHTFFRLNYPIRLNRWYHSCFSWNGRTGEWQLWVNAERVGRGFHNRLVGHKIPGGGIAISGQEQRQLGGGFLEGHEAPKGSGGMLGEITMVQLYKVALTAGKAHRNHKHHHAHKFHHEGVQTTTEAPIPSTTQSPQLMHPFLTGNQLNHMLRLNYAGGQPEEPSQPIQIVPVDGQTYNTHLLNEQLLSQLVSEQLSKAPDDSNRLVLPTKTPARSNTVLVNSGLVHPHLVNPANVQFIDTTHDVSGHQFIFKRNSDTKATVKTQTKISKRDTSEVESTDQKSHSKRGLFMVGDALYDDGLGSHMNAAALSVPYLEGLAVIGDNQPVLQEQQHASEDREPAEAEVRAVMNVCSGCDEEPFEKALVFGWRSVPKKLYSGAFFTPAIPECKAF